MISTQTPLTRDDIDALVRSGILTDIDVRKEETSGFVDPRDLALNGVDAYYRWHVTARLAGTEIKGSFDERYVGRTSPMDNLVRSLTERHAPEPDRTPEPPRPTMDDLADDALAAAISGTYVSAHGRLRIARLRADAQAGPRPVDLEALTIDDIDALIKAGAYTSLNVSGKPDARKASGQMLGIGFTEDYATDDLPAADPSAVFCPGESDRLAEIMLTSLLDHLATASEYRRACIARAVAAGRVLLARDEAA